MLAKSLIKLYLSPEWHGVTNWTKGWGGRPQHYAPLYTKGKHLLAIYKKGLPKNRLAPICCASCLWCGVSNTLIPYGKLLPYCYDCIDDTPEDITTVHVKGMKWRDLLIRALWPQYNALEAEFIICQAIQEMKLEKTQNLANPSELDYTKPLTLKQRLQGVSR